jgi:ankyrin repeat protein
MMGREAVVKLLLARDGVDPNSGDSMGPTPLLWALEKQHKAVAELLLARNDVRQPYYLDL